MAKFEDSNSNTSKVTAFLCKVPTEIFVNPGKCPCKAVKTENDIAPSKSNILQRHLDRKCIFNITNQFIKKMKI